MAKVATEDSLMGHGDILLIVESFLGIYMEILNGANLIVWNHAIIIQQENINHVKDLSPPLPAKEIAFKTLLEIIVQTNDMLKMYIN